MSDIADAFLRGTLAQRLTLASDDANAADLIALLGDAGYSEYRALTARLDTRHLAWDSAKNLIFIPGIMGSLLQSTTRAGVWWVDVRTRDRINDLRLSPDGTQDYDPGNAVEPFGIDYSYDGFLSAALQLPDFGHASFPYDWRKPLNFSTSRLRDLILEMWAQNTGPSQAIHVVAHSMGGLVLRATLMEHGAELWPKIGRIVFIATPHYGSPAIAGYLKNHLWGFDLMALMGLYLSRDTFRSLWGALTLLPAPRGVYPGTRVSDNPPWRPDDADDTTYVHPCANFDMYSADAWKLGLSPSDLAQLQTILDGVGAYAGRLSDWHASLDQELRDKMLVIAGVGCDTLFRLEYARRFFGQWEYTKKITSRIAGDPNRDGDGSVPLASAALENVEIRYAQGAHAALPNMKAVYEGAFDWLRGKNPSLPNTVDEALSTHLGADDGSETPSLDGTPRAEAKRAGDPGRWNEAQPDPARLALLQTQLAQEQLPAFTRVRLL